MQTISILSLLILSFFSAADKDKTENINLDFNIHGFESIRIHNYKGDVKIRAYNGNSLQITGIKTIRSKTDSGLKEGMEKVDLDTTIIDGEFIVFINTPGKHFTIDEDGNSYYNSEDWNSWNKKKIKDPDYSFEFTLDIKIPTGKKLYAATHLENIDVAGMNNDLIVKNHHGDVKVKTNSEILTVITHHGDITVENASQTTKKGIFKTHHGDISTAFANLSADVSMDTYHGDLYTDYEYKIQPMLVSLEENTGQMTTYKYKAKNNLKIGSGEGSLKYKTHHGDIFIKKLNNNG